MNIGSLSYQLPLSVSSVIALTLPTPSTAYTRGEVTAGHEQRRLSDKIKTLQYVSGLILVLYKL
jgi:hypothetical protein